MTATVSLRLVDYLEGGSRVRVEWTNHVGEHVASLDVDPRDQAGADRAVGALVAVVPHAKTGEQSLHAHAQAVLAAAAWPAPQPLAAVRDLPPFPLDDAFPFQLDWLRDFIRAVATSYQVPIDLPAMLALPVASLAVARKIEAKPQPDWREPTPLWSMVLLESGERKSAVFDRLLRPIYDWQTERAESLRDAIARFASDIAVLEARLKRAQREAAGKGATATVAQQQARDIAVELAERHQNAPQTPALVVTDATGAALAQVMARNGERALVASPEGTALDVALGRFTKDGAGDFDLWLAGHAGDAIDVLRRTREPDRLRRPALCVALAVQPEAVRALFASRLAHGKGLLARFLCSVPRSLIGHRVLQPPPVPLELADRWSMTIKGLLDVASPERVEDIAFVSLAPEAAELFLGHRNAVEHDLVDPEDDRSWLSKLPGHVLRIASTLHALAHGVDGGPIGEHVMRSALAWVPYLRAHAAHVGAVAGEDPAVSVAERVLSWTRRRRRSRFSRRDAFDAVRGAACPRVETIDPALTLLEDRGWIRRMLDQPRDGGRPPSPVFVVNPGPQNPQNPADDPSCAGCAGSAGSLGSEREAAQASGAGEQSDQGEREAGIDGKDGEPGWIA